MSARLFVTGRITPGGCVFTVRGREAWALLELVKAGPNGCSPIDNPGPRWSAYVHSLRHVHGFHIETRHEAHKGPFPGTHARYVLMNKVEILQRSNERERMAA